MRPTLKILLPALAVSLTLAACGSSSKGSSYTSTTSAAPAASSSSAGSSASAADTQAVKSAANSTLGATVLVNAQGRTLYHLSGERPGHFLCTGACESAWPPVSASATSSAISGLAAVKRPDGSEQLAYKGEPLYTFSGDRASGEANGQGIKDDGGTWSAVTTSATASSSASSSGSSSSGSGYGY
jgi:predicted lipoprotein with Yx(FWY)xxD motif